MISSCSLSVYHWLCVHYLIVFIQLILSHFNLFCSTPLSFSSILLFFFFFTSTFEASFYDPLLFLSRGLNTEIVFPSPFSFFIFCSINHYCFFVFLFQSFIFFFHSTPFVFFNFVIILCRF